ncbi:MAG: prephenate dehydrogenase/arogenate dehydrogenase family protein [Actinobacteria bacterium]|nr:prephenate dehydrogenase/arogenate dehydrogenase family protein [Actinomycetota bacterium]
MGGSLGLALRRAGVTPIRGVDPDRQALEDAARLGAVDATTTSIAEGVAGAASVVIAAPVPRIPDLAREVFVHAPADCLVTDIGSAKRAVVDALSAEDRVRFVGGHPICGGEQCGVGFARADLFNGATWFLTPTAETRPDLYERAHSLVAATGAVPTAISAGVHDRLMALVSHVPHVLASALIDQAANTAPEGREALRSAGPSFDDLTRVAGSNPPLWADILLANRAALVETLDEYRERLDVIAAAVVAGDRAAVESFFAHAADARDRLRAVQRAQDAVDPWEVTAVIPDQPGTVSDIATALGHAHINIRDLVLHPGPPGGVGELVLRIGGAEDARAAAAMIRERGYTVWAAPA